MATTQIRGNTQIIAGTITNAEINASAAIATAKLAQGASFLQKDGSVALTASLPAGGFQITGLGTPVGANDAVRLTDLNAVQQGLDVKASVRVATTTAAQGGGNITLTGTQTIDAIGLSSGDRVLVKDQTTGSQNGIWVVAAGSWARATDADTDPKVTSGLFTFVEQGTNNGDSGWMLTTDGTITVGTTSLTFVQFSGAGQVVAGAGLTKTGNSIDVIGTANRIVVAADSIDIGTDVVTLTGSQTLTNKSIATSQLTGTLPAANFPALTGGDVTSTGGSLSTTIANNVVTLGKLAALAANSVIGNSTGSGATPTAVPLLTTPTASAIALRDANANVLANNFIAGFTTTATAAATTTLTVANTEFQQFTGSTTQIVVLPAANTLTLGHSFIVANRSTGVVTVNANGGSLVQTMAAGSQATFIVTNIGSSTGAWDSSYSITGAGTVTTVSVASANGFAGTVANASTTPAITLTTSISGILKGSGNALVAATVGTDFVNNASFVVRETPGGSLPGTAFTLANTPTVGTEQVYLNGMLQEPGAGNDYTILTTAITFLSTVQTTDRLRVSYMK